MCFLEHATGLHKIKTKVKQKETVSAVKKYVCDIIRINFYYRNEKYSIYGMSNIFAF